jgi:parvulin-like peptidyl-prolyl isomerase
VKNAIVPLIAGILFAIASPAFPQMIIENPAKPDNPRAGRVVTLEEVMRIEDTGKDFYIKAVYGLQVAGDGSVFVQDEQKQLLQRGRQAGHFIRYF